MIVAYFDIRFDLFQVAVYQRAEISGSSLGPITFP